MDRKPGLMMICLLMAIIACGTPVRETAYYACPTPPPPTAHPYHPGTPLAPATLFLTVTPFRLTAPQDFYVGDAVFVGQAIDPLRLRFRLLNIQSRPAPSLNGSPRQQLTWQLEIRNLGRVTYETVPAVLMLVTRIRTTDGDQTGSWRISQAAMTAAGYTHETYDPLAPGATHSYQLAALVPAGQVLQITYLLDGDGSYRLTWINAINPHCPSLMTD